MFKKAILVVGGLLVVLIVVALAAPFFISVDTYKGQIIAKVEAATGRKLTIDGAMSLSFFPVAGITVEKVTLSNPVGFSDTKPFIALDSMRIDIAVMPLLSKQIVIKDFTLKDPIINMHADKNGIKNWVFTPPTTADASTTPTANIQVAIAATAPAQVTEKHPVSHSSPLPAGFMLNNFQLKNGTVLYTDGNAPPIELKKLNASVVLQSTADAAAINGSGEWNGKTVTVKAGIGTLKSILENQKTEINLALKSDNFTLTADGNYDRGAFTGKESFKTNSLKEIALWLNPGKPIAIAAPLAFKIDSDIRCGTGYCSLGNYNFTLDALVAKGNMKVAFGDSKPAIDITLATDRLDFNPFLPPQQTASLDNIFISEANAQAAERWSDQPIDLSALNALNATATIKADSLLFRKIALSKVQLNIKLQQGVLKADVTNATLYKGTATASVNVNGSQSPALLDAHVMMKAVEVAPLLKDVANFDRLTGAADIQTNVQSNCRSMKSLISALSGDGQMQLLGGEIKHFDITDILQNVTGSFDNASKTAKSTVFTKLGGSFTIAGGVISNRDLAMETQNLTVSGNGTVNLPAYTINYHLLPKLVRTTKDAKGASTAKEGLTVPVIVEGSLDNPQFRPDLNAAVQNVLQDPSKLKEQLKNSKGALKDQLKNPEAVKNIKNLLQGLGR